ncbi:transglutaminase family protein [Fluviicola sp.]|jgi:transglutaminase-like putative cysteine protease|uniref:transglutaminase-like domain-containing protein n=1 Tax=Fluviicola sp. TaxID=1917219 RepID=UPI002831C164|nr:transglutaminase family protein [Fluviicola sp.]MDR0800956.1 transglutaminase family protein [Fluviicola sp.]
MKEQLNAENWREYLIETPQMDFSDPEVKQFIADIPVYADSKQQAIAIYQAVRDAFLYDLYHLDLRRKSLKASVVVGKKRAWCVEKSLLVCACFRAFGFPSRLGFGIVKNHIGVEKLKAYLKRDEIVFHGYAEVWIGGGMEQMYASFRSEKL